MMILADFLNTKTSCWVVMLKNEEDLLDLLDLLVLLLTLKSGVSHKLDDELRRLTK